MAKSNKPKDKSKKDSACKQSGAEPKQESKPVSILKSPDLSIIRINLAIFSLFTALVFSYFVFFSHQLTEVKAEILSKILEINAINPPQPMSFITIPANTEYFYLNRKNDLLPEFLNLKTSLYKDDMQQSDVISHGKRIQEIITQIAYFFPFKRMLDFHKDGSVTFDPNNYESIQATDNLNTNIPPYAKNKRRPNNYDSEFLKQQVDEINDMHRRFTLKLKDGKDKIIDAMILSNNLTTDYHKNRLRKYINSLIEYLENHHKLAIPLGLTIIRSDYLIRKANTKLIFWLSFLISLNFLSGVVLPLFIEKLRVCKVFWAVPLIIFIIGIVILFSASVYSLPIKG